MSYKVVRYNNLEILYRYKSSEGGAGGREADEPFFTELFCEKAHSIDEAGDEAERLAEMGDGMGP